MSGLTRKKVTVKGKRGTYQRSVMVRAGEAIKRTAGKVGRFANKHKGKLGVAGALVAGAVMARNHIHRANVRRKASNYHDTVNRDWIPGSPKWAAFKANRMHVVRGSDEARAWGYRVRGDRSEDLDYAAQHAREQSAERSGHFSTRYPGYKGKIPRLRLGAGR